MAPVSEGRIGAKLCAHAGSGHELFQGTVQTLYVSLFTSDMSCSQVAPFLSAFIISELMVKLYPVRLLEEAHRRRRFLDDLEARLHQWLINLPEELQFREGGPRPLPAPHVVILHIEYHAAILLLHRAL